MTILVTFVVGLIVMSFVEFIVHRYIMHTQKMPSFVYKMVPLFEKSFHNHAVEHHARYYKVFNYEVDPHGRETSIKLDYSVGIAGAMIACVPLWLLVAPAASITFLIVVLGHHWLWNLIHTEMHNPVPKRISRAAWFRFFARYHWMHHRHVNKNYNVVLPFADFVLNRHQRPSASEMQEMRSIGLC